MQNYENYWKITNAFTNYNGKKFLDTLRVCISADVKAFWKNYQLEKSILNKKRKYYLAYHRKLMAQKDLN